MSSFFFVSLANPKLKIALLKSRKLLTTSPSQWDAWEVNWTPHNSRKTENGSRFWKTSHGTWRIFEFPAFFRRWIRVIYSTFFDWFFVNKNFMTMSWKFWVFLRIFTVNFFNALWVIFKEKIVDLFVIIRYFTLWANSSKFLQFFRLCVFEIFYPSENFEPPKNLVLEQV